VSEDTARPQDVGRRHRRTAPGPAPETVAILERYREALRLELADVLEELRPDRAQLTIAGGETRLRPALAERLKLWDLAIKIGRELSAPGAEHELEDAPAPSTSSSPSPRSTRAPHLSAKDRRALGG
jgi:hypothetical protein